MSMVMSISVIYMTTERIRIPQNTHHELEEYKS